VAFSPGRTGLIGVNGSGKSTLLRLIAGELRPGSGTIRARGEVGYLPQAITLGTSRSVCDLLGITAARNALHAIEAGETGEDAFAAVGDDWDVEERARAWLNRLGLGRLDLDDRVERLSGGETILVALAALFLRRPDIMLLDEPTNNLDLDARKRLYDAVASWAGVMVIISHDRELLGLVDQVADLSGEQIRMYGGNLAAYEEQLAAEQAAAERAVTTAAADLRRERRDFVDAQVKQARRDRQGRRLAASGSMPRIVAGARKRAAQETAGRSRELHADVRLGAVTGYLPQRLDLLDDSLTVVENVRAAAPAASVNEVRASLARFLFRGERADRLARTLSGGERFRAVLAALLLAQPAPQLLLLDEPTNNLDMASVRQLSQALDGYRGAILVASHDVPFLRSVGITRWLRLDREAGLTAIDPL
jgi:ATPase subunit of ABC transporter with duplicated ATPase domains